MCDACVLMQAPRAMLLPLALALLASVTSAYQLPAARGANSCAAGAARSGYAVRMDATEDRIKELIDENKIMLFMKGNKMFPQCGFSNTAVMSKRSLKGDRTVGSLAWQSKAVGSLAEQSNPVLAPLADVRTRLPRAIL